MTVPGVLLPPARPLAARMHLVSITPGAVTPPLPDDAPVALTRTPTAAAPDAKR